VKRLRAPRMIDFSLAGQALCAPMRFMILDNSGLG
jgi:hypothetical protein